MNLKTIISLFSLSICLISCGEKTAEKGTTTVEDTTSVVSNPNDASFKATDTYDASQLKDGAFESFYPNGELQAQGYVENGKRVGKWTSFHPNGNKQSENEYNQGTLEGKTMATFPNGQMMYIGYYSDGKYDGQWMYFKKDGTLDKEIIYKDGKIVSTTIGELSANEK